MTVAHVHLDPLGGIAGDMFVACMVDAFPEFEAAALDAAQSVANVACRRVAHRDHVLVGARFLVDAGTGKLADGHGASHHAQATSEISHSHTHTSWHEIRSRIVSSQIPRATGERAIDIFEHLAKAEGHVHGIQPEAVTFHELGAADSIADIVAAASLIEAVAAATWSVGPLPLGGGIVKTAHGALPVPAPAVALLLPGFDMVDDGLPGERVTPTGAAILRHLGCVPRGGLRGMLDRTGIGFGSRRLPGMSNVLRALAFKASIARQPVSSHRELAVIEFEVDDQSPEDLATGLERIRSSDGVHDIIQVSALGKKGRMTAHIQVLARPDALENATDACFRETTTIGLRTHIVQGRVLPRQIREVSVDGTAVRVKSVERPGGRTSKAESDDSTALPGHGARTRLRRQAEEVASKLAEADRAS